MRFRTEIESEKGAFAISHGEGILLLGSCFTDNIGSRLSRDGFDATFNPMGPLYNPVSLWRLLNDLISGRRYDSSDFRCDGAGVYHCLDFASRYQSADGDELARRLNTELESLRNKFNRAGTIIVTFGSSVVYSLGDRVGDAVGNCHKFPSSMFSRLAMTVDDIVGLWRPMLEELRSQGKNVIVTVSPIRHLADGLHGNELSKARLLLACDALGELCEYFPSYEIMMDDLRDYRFYDRDLKHPSDVACDYIYEKFGERYFTRDTLATAVRERERSLREAHRPLL